MRFSFFVGPFWPPQRRVFGFWTLGLGVLGFRRRQPGNECKALDGQARALVFIFKWSYSSMVMGMDAEGSGSRFIKMICRPQSWSC